MTAIELFLRLCARPETPMMGALTYRSELSPLMQLGLVRPDGFAEFAVCPHCDPPQMARVSTSVSGVAVDCETHGFVSTESDDVTLYRLNPEATAQIICDALQTRSGRVRELDASTWALGRFEIAQDRFAAMYLMLGDIDLPSMQDALDIIRKQPRVDRRVLFWATNNPLPSALLNSDEEVLPLEEFLVLLSDGSIAIDGAGILGVLRSSASSAAGEDAQTWLVRLPPVVCDLWDRLGRKPSRREVKEEICRKSSSSEPPSESTIARAIQDEERRRAQPPGRPRSTRNDRT